MAYVIWTKKAFSQLERAVRYIKEESGTSYAEIILDKILFSTRNLTQFPQMGQIEYFLSHKKSEYRYILVWSYKIVYRINKDKITVSRLFHTSQNPGKLDS